MTEKCLHCEISHVVIQFTSGADGPVPVKSVLASLADVMADLIAAIPDEDKQIECQEMVEEYLDVSIDEALEKIKDLRANLMQHQETVH